MNIQTTFITDGPIMRLEQIITAVELAPFAKLDLIEWEFTGFETQYSTHRFHSYPARFIPQIPQTFIRLFTREGDTVLDPFCGCGTTLVEAFLHNRHAIGNDFNPLACLIARTKTRVISPAHVTLLRKYLNTIRAAVNEPGAPLTNVPKLPNRKLSRIFDAPLMRELTAIRDGIAPLRDDATMDIYELARTAFSATIWSIVNTENGNHVWDSFYNKVQLMTRTNAELQRTIQHIPAIQVLYGDARNLQVPDETAHLVVTSPPYVNALDYYRVHQYNMSWLGMDFVEFRRHEIGGHSHFIANRFKLLAEYLGDMCRAMSEMSRALKPQGVCAIVVGNSSLEYELIASHKFFTAFAEPCGFAFKKLLFRNIDKSRKYTSANIGKIDDEYILVLQKVSAPRVRADDDAAIAEIVKAQMERFAQQVDRQPGSSRRGKPVTEERLRQNSARIRETIDTIAENIKIK